LQAKHHIGIDFGTSSSYFCVIPSSVFKPNPICFDGVEAIDTAVLWEGNGQDKRVRTFGTTAVKEWGFRTPEEKKTCALATQFKPDISVSEEAAQNAAAFLQCAAEYMNSSSVLPRGLPASDFPVVLGFPANALPGHEQKTREIIAHSGFFNVKLVKEPIGALVHHVSREDLPVHETRKGILVIDFGGGTCDVAYLLRLDIRHASGDPLLGGRLFDDLFYQWFCEVNPDAVSKFREAGDSYYIHWVRCREMKEAFSNTMRRSREEKFHFNIPGYGSMQNVTWEMFEERARSYVPSVEFFEQLHSYGQRYSALVGGIPVDLFQRFEDAVKSGVQSGNIPLEHIERIILTGGSSLWPFVREIVCRALQVDDARIIESSNPRGAIGEGLALLPVLQSTFKNSIKKLQAEQAGMSRTILEMVDDCIRRFCNQLCEDISVRIMQEQIIPALDSFRESGGKLSELRSGIESDITKCQPELRTFVTDRAPELSAKIEQIIETELTEWFQSRHIRCPFVGVDVSSPEHSLDSRLISSIMNEITLMISPIIAVIIASICGGGGVALLLEGPWGLVIGAFIALAGVFAGRKAIELVPLKPGIVKLILNAGTMKYIRWRAEKKLRSSLTRTITEKLDSEREKLADSINTMIQERIDDLSALDAL
jgi:hypothetical protein